MSRIKATWICLSSLLLVFFLVLPAVAVDIRLVPDTTQVFPGQTLGVSVQLENVPATGLSVIQFRLHVAATGGEISGVGDLDTSPPDRVGVSAPLNSAVATSHFSGLGEFILNQAGESGILLLDNNSFSNDSSPFDVSGFFSFARTADAAPLQGSGVVARFMLKIGSAAAVEQLRFSLTDVVILDADLSAGPNEYSLDNNPGSTVDVGCKTQVPQLLGVSQDEAVLVLQSANLSFGSVYEVDNQLGDKALGIVLEQSVDVGQTLECGQQVDLAINQAPSDIGNLQSEDLPDDQTGAVKLSWIPSASADIAGYEIYQDSTLLETITDGNSVEATLTGLVNGQSTLLRLVAFDNYGNKSPGVSVAAVPLDDVFPAVTLATVLPGLTNQGNLSLSGSIDTDAELNVVNLSSGSSASVVFPTPGTWQAEIMLTEGENLIRVSAHDPAGNLTELSEQVVVLDTTSPLATVVAVQSPVATSDFLLKGTVEAGASLLVEAASEVSVGAVSYAENNWSCQLSGLKTGDNHVTVTAVDNAGNLTELQPVTIVYQPPLVLELGQEVMTADESLEIAINISLATSTDTVWLEQVSDVNANGSVDPFEPVIRRLKLVDENNDGTISKSLNMLNVLTIDHAPGQYLIRVTDGTNIVLKSFRVVPVSKPQTLQGRITDGVNGLAGVQVQLINKWQRPVAWAITGTNGDYLFQVPEAASYSLLPQAEGHAFDRNTAALITVAASAVTTAPDVAMVAGTNSISGHVSSGTTGLAGIQVVATGSLGNGYFGRTLTAEDGSYSLSLPDGDYTIEVVADGYAGPSARGCLTDTTTDVALSVNSDQAGIDFDLPTAAVSVSGSVTDETTMPVAGVPVVAISNDEIVAMVVTSADGSFHLPLAENSSYVVTVETDIATSLGYVGQQFTVQTGTADITGQNLSIHAIESWITGTVTDESSLPLTVLPVHLRSGDDLYSLSTNTTVDGEYLFGAFAGTWYVRAETEAQGFTAATESEVVLLSGQPDQVDFVATNSGGDESCTVCHSVMTENTTCLDCHDMYQSQHHAEAQNSPWNFGCMDCHDFFGGSMYPTVEDCAACHVSLDPAKPTVEDIHHNLSDPPVL